MPTEDGRLVSFVVVVDPSALATPATVSIAVAVSSPSGRPETFTRIANLPLAPMIPLPETEPEPPVIWYQTVAPIWPLITSGASVWSPFETYGAISTIGAAGAPPPAPLALGGSVFGELIGRMPEVRS